MTDNDHDGWPEKYRDPRDRPHPDVLRITVTSFEATVEDTVDAIDAVSAGATQPAVVSFDTVGELRRILTDRRIELLRALMATDGAADSIAGLATALDRNYRTVHEDVTLLADCGLVFVIEAGQAKQPYVPYDRIHLDVEFAGGTPDEATPA